MKDHTQYGEKSIIDNYFKKRVGFFLDVGAADGITNSNTYHLAQEGWSGVLIEPCRHFLTILKHLYSDSTKIKIFEGALSDFNGKSSFYVYESGEDSQISTIDLNQKKSIESGGWFKGKFTESYDVDVMTPADMFNKTGMPQKIEFVDIDAEGSDMKILKSWPWDKYDVELFCIEHSMGKNELIGFMLTKGYKEFFSTAGNCFFVKY